MIVFTFIFNTFVYVLKILREKKKLKE